MDENTNSAGAVDSEEVFGETAEETTDTGTQGNAESEVEDAAGAAEEATEEQTGEQTIRIKYNGEDIDVPLSEAATLCQKGKNYEKLEKRYNDFQNGEEMTLIKNFAKQAGMSVKRWVKFAAEQQVNTLVESELKAIMAADPDVDPKIAQELAESRAAKKRAVFTEQQDEADMKPWDDFMAAYPEMGTDVKKLPAEVQTRIANGETPVSAMRDYELQQERAKTAELQRKLAAQQKNQENKKASTGSAKSTGGEKPQDPFLEGFLT